MEIETKLHQINLAVKLVKNQYKMDYFDYDILQPNFVFSVNDSVFEKVSEIADFYRDANEELPSKIQQIESLDDLLTLIRSDVSIVSEAVENEALPSTVDIESLHVNIGKAITVVQTALETIPSSDAVTY